MQDGWTTLRVLEWTTRRFARAGVSSPRLDAQVLLAHALGCDRIALYTGADKPLNAAELASIRQLIRRRLEGEPVAYLVGGREFWSHPYRVDARVLIPRPDSEILIELVLDSIADRGAPVTLADIGTGAGVLAITLARELPAARVVATDIAPQALELAGENARESDVAGRIEFRRGDLLEPLATGERFDVVLANLPYVATEAIDHLPAEVQREPRQALDGGTEGLDLLRRLVAGAGRHLVSGGLLALEHAPDQGARLAELVAATKDFTPARIHTDLAKRPRVTSARRRH